MEFFSNLFLVKGGEKSFSAALRQLKTAKKKIKRDVIKAKEVF